MVRFYNSLTRQKEAFIPLHPNKVGMYVCGITVYDYCHLGHARSMVCFDVIVRFLRSQGYDVTYVRNITDIDDKIIVRAIERNQEIDVLTETYIQAMNEDSAALGNLSPNIEPRATNYITPIIRLIERLLDKKHAYITASGDVCYHVNSFPEYGKLAHKDISGLIAGARVEVVSDKQSPLDFVLWKMAKAGEPSWPSPWGEGRPGWHIECSAMAMGELSEQFDIHGGGLDLQFPHHENEIAQSEGATDKPFARYWLHVGMLQVNQEKMAKSTGNFFTIRDVLKKYHPDIVRYFLLSNHYRSPLNYSEENMVNAGRSLSRLYQSLKAYTLHGDEPIDMVWVEQFNAVMADDINTPEALSILFRLSHALNKESSVILAATLRYLGGLLGFLQYDPSVFLKNGQDSNDDALIASLIDERTEARGSRDWAKADRIRDTLLKKGIELEDGPNGTVWRMIIS